MRIPSGKIDQTVPFVAYDSVDLVTRKTGLTTFTVYRSRNGGAPVLYTTPTVTEISAANMPGLYSLLIDEDTTIASTSDSETYCVHITQASMAPVTREDELYRRDTTSGATNVAQTGDSFARIGATGSGLTSLATQTSVDDVPTNAELATALAAADDAVLTAVATRSSQTSVDDLPTNSELATALGTADDAVLAAIAALNNISAAGVRAAIGLATANLDTQLGDLPTNTELATALVTADDATLAAISALNALAVLIDAKTTNLPTDPADQSLIITATNAIIAAIAALNNLSAAQARAEMVDALNVDTYAEPTGVPAATASLVSKLGRLHQALRNGLDVTATAKTFKDDAGVALWKKTLADDGTTYSETEAGAP